MFADEREWQTVVNKNKKRSEENTHAVHAEALRAQRYRNTVLPSVQGVEAQSRQIQQSNSLNDVLAAGVLGVVARDDDVGASHDGSGNEHSGTER